MRALPRPTPIWELTDERQPSLRLCQDGLALMRVVVCVLAKLEWVTAKVVNLMSYTFPAQYPLFLLFGRYISGASAYPIFLFVLLDLQVTERDERGGSGAGAELHVGGAVSEKG